MSTVVIGATLADAEEFCQRNPDFSGAIRRSARTSYPKDGLIVTGLVLTPRAKSARGGNREYVRQQFLVAQRELSRSSLGAMSRSQF